MLIVKELWKKGGNSFLLKDVSFSVKQDQWSLITGPTNEGKEILQQILLGFDLDWQGEVLLSNKSIKRQETQTKIELISNRFLDSSNNETIRERLALPLKLKALTDDEIEEQIKKITEPFFSIKKINTPISKLTYFEKIELAYIRALITEPELIIIEEPFAEKPESKRNLIRNAFVQLQSFPAKCAVVLFSCYMNIWNQLCDNIILIHNNKIIQKGTKYDLMKNPQSVFAAKYVLGEQISLIHGYLRGTSFVTEGLRFPFPSDLLQKSFYSDGQELILGIKYTDVKAAKESDDFEKVVTFHAPIQFITEEKLYTNIGGQPVIALNKGLENRNINQWMRLSIHLDGIYIFDGKEMNRLN